MPDDTTVSVRYLVEDVATDVDFYTLLLLSGPTSSVGGAMADGVTFRNEMIHGPGGAQVICDPSGNFVELFQPAAG